jgi:hypothetical protein
VTYFIYLCINVTDESDILASSEGMVPPIIRTLPKAKSIVIGDFDCPGRAGHGPNGQVDSDDE